MAVAAVAVAALAAPESVGLPEVLPAAGGSAAPTPPQPWGWPAAGVVHVGRLGSVDTVFCCFSVKTNLSFP